jgi:aspartate-semialdehyde dehydrogenase
VVDLSEDPGLDDATAWIPALDALAGRPAGAERGMLRSPSAAAIVSASFAAALDRFRPTRLVMNCLRPVSECGQQGIDELERQTTRLLSFQPVSGGIFDSQVAFNLMDSYGSESAQSLDAVRQAILRDSRTALGGKIAVPVLWLLQAPVFFSYAFTVYAELGEAADKTEIEAALRSAGFDLGSGSEPRPTNLSVAGQPRAALGKIVSDGSRGGAFWFWGVADNARLVAANAVSIIESLV